MHKIIEHNKRGTQIGCNYGFEDMLLAAIKRLFTH